MKAARALERAIASACLGEAAGEELASDLPGFLQRHGAEPEDVDATVGGRPRLAVYRSLVRNGLSGVVLRMLPRTRARMNAACVGRFDADFARFVDQVGPRTHYLRDVPAELFAWAEGRWRGDPSVPAYLPDLAAFELASFAVSASAPVPAPAGQSGPPRSTGEVALDRPLAFGPSARRLDFGWAVHELPAGEDSFDAPAERAVHLLAYRDGSHAVRWLELTPIAARIADGLLSGIALGAAVQAACADAGVSPPSVAAEVARLLADLAERGVLLGAA
jgi:hypothetical protein